MKQRLVEARGVQVNQSKQKVCLELCRSMNAALQSCADENLMVSTPLSSQSHISSAAALAAHLAACFPASGLCGTPPADDSGWHFASSSTANIFPAQELGAPQANLISYSQAA